MSLMAPQEAAGLARALFKESRSADDTQVTEFGFASACLKLGGSQSLEIGIDAEPAYSKLHGLHFSMTLIASLCEKDGCQTIFSKKLSADLAGKLCKSKAPIADAFGAHPKLMETAMTQIEAFGRLARGASFSLAEAKALGKSSLPGAKGPKPSRI